MGRGTFIPGMEIAEQRWSNQHGEQGRKRHRYRDEGAGKPCHRSKGSYGWIHWALYSWENAFCDRRKEHVDGPATVTSSGLKKFFDLRAIGLSPRTRLQAYEDWDKYKLKTLHDARAVSGSNLPRYGMVRLSEQLCMSRSLPGFNGLTKILSRNKVCSSW